MTTAKNNYQWLSFETAEDVAQATKQAILIAEQKALKKSGEFKIVLAGGTTPERIYGLLADEPCSWDKWQIYLGDERCLPIDDPDRNSEMISHRLLNKVNIPYKNIHFIPADLGSEDAAASYAEEISKIMPFDLVLLGMGEDGHTASLFPGHVHQPNELVHAVHDAPKPPSERVSLSASSLSNSREVIMIITGESKQQAIQQWKQGTVLPITTISSLGNIKIMLDQAAFPT